MEASHNSLPLPDDSAALSRLSQTTTSVADSLSALPDLSTDAQAVHDAVRSLDSVPAMLAAVAQLSAEATAASESSLTQIRRCVALNGDVFSNIARMSGDLISMADRLSAAGTVFEAACKRATTSLQWNMAFTKILSDACEEIARDPSQVEAIVARLANQPGLVGLETAAFLTPAAHRTSR